MRVSPQQVVRRWLLAYQTKSSQPIEMSMSPVKDENRGWVLQTATAHVEGVKAGYLRFEYIPKSTADRMYPTVLHYVVRIRGYYVEGDVSTPEGARGAMLKILGFSPTDPITNRKLTNLLNKKFGDEYRRFMDYHVDKPQVGYVSVDVVRQGVGSALYEYAARELAKRGLSLWSSTTQSTEAKAVWASMVARGYPVVSHSTLNGTRLSLTY